MLVRASGVPKSIGYLMGACGLAYVAQGWVLGSEGFSAANTAAILAGIVLLFSWSVWLLVTAWGSSDRRTPHVSRREGERSSSPPVPLSVPERGDEERLWAPRARAPGIMPSRVCAASPCRRGGIRSPRTAARPPFCPWRRPVPVPARRRAATAEPLRRDNGCHPPTPEPVSY